MLEDEVTRLRVPLEDPALQHLPLDQPMTLPVACRGQAASPDHGPHGLTLTLSSSGTSAIVRKRTPTPYFS